jgi:CRP/FNR family transcriptional regulator, cyclic AMP receptor protein
MNLDAFHFDQHSSCESLTASIASLPRPQECEKPIVFQESEFIWLATDAPLHLYTLKSGRVEITETNRKGKSTLVRIVEPGQMFGYLCFCPHRDEPRGTEARAISSSVAYRTGYKNFKAVLSKDPSAVSRLVENLCLRSFEADRRASMLAIHDAKKRLATLLLQLATIRAEKLLSHKGPIALYTSHAELAALASLTRPHTTVLMNRFRALGCVGYGRGTAISVYVRRLESYV